MKYIGAACAAIAIFVGLAMSAPVAVVDAASSFSEAELDAVEGPGAGA